MKNAFYETCRAIIETQDLKEKKRLTHSLLQMEAPPGDANQQIKIAPEAPIDFLPIKDALPEPGRPQGFRVVLPQEMPKRKSLRNARGYLQLFHSLAQIELAAIEIDAAMLALYPQAPKSWKEDWLRIIADEIQHYELLTGYLADHHFPFGQEPIHMGLWHVFLKGHSWMEHIAIATRYQEANGVDASYTLLQQVKQGQKEFPWFANSLPILERVHVDEIKHVSFGSKWWHWAYETGVLKREQATKDLQSCDRFFSTVAKYVPNPWSLRIPFYLQGREKCGYNRFEMERFQELQKVKQEKVLHKKGANKRG